MTYLLKSLLPIMLIGTLTLLVSCGTSAGGSKIDEPRRLEWGKRGTIPTVSENYDWVCGSTDRYRLEER